MTGTEPLGIKTAMLGWERAERRGRVAVGEFSVNVSLASSENGGGARPVRCCVAKQGGWFQGGLVPGGGGMCLHG